MDLHSRAILGYHSDDQMPAELVAKSLQKAVNDWNLSGKNCIFHSDRGSQYTSKLLRKQLKKLKFQQSMSAKGNCYDNATCESFFASLKRELIPPSGYFETKKQAQIALFEHIDGFYIAVPFDFHTVIGMCFFYTQNLQLNIQKKAK